MPSNSTQSDLTASLDALERLDNKYWSDRLEPRKRAELEFHDQDRRTDVPVAEAKRLHANRKYYATTGASVRYMDEWIRTNSPGRVFLDYACGNGRNAVLAAKASARLAIGIDLSSVSVNNAQKRAAAEGVGDRTRFVQADCEDTGLPDGSVDLIVCSGMLHHLDLDRAFPEMKRILAPGGRVLAYEALNYNPLLKAYRALTPHMRTEWEKAHILSLRDLRRARKYFVVENVKYWHITSPVATAFRKTPIFGGVLRLFNGADSLLSRIPGLQLMAWIFTFELRR